MRLWALDASLCPGLVAALHSLCPECPVTAGVTELDSSVWVWAHRCISLLLASWASQAAPLAPSAEKQSQPLTRGQAEAGHLIPGPPLASEANGSMPLCHHPDLHQARKWKGHRHQAGPLCQSWPLCSRGQGGLVHHDPAGISLPTPSSLPDLNGGKKTLKTKVCVVSASLLLLTHGRLLDKTRHRRTQARRARCS